MKRVLQQYQYHFLENELKELEGNGHLRDGQATDLMTNYEVQQYVVPEKKKVNPFNILLIIGAVLIGLSLLSFVASNWSELTKVSKFTLLFVMLVGFYFTGYKYEAKNKALSRVFYYIGVFAYCAEVIYIGQMFHLGGEIQNAILAWGLGVLPLGFYLKDQALKLIGVGFIYLFIHIQFMFVENNYAYVMLAIIPLMFVFGHYVMKRSLLLLVVNFIVLYEFIQMHVIILPLKMDRFPFEILFVLVIMFFIGHKVMKKSLPLFINNIVLSLETIGIFIGFYGESYAFTIAAIAFFIIGMTMTHIQHKEYKVPMQIIGIVLHIIAGVLLTFNDVWWDLVKDMDVQIALSFAFFYILYNLFYVRQGKLINVLVLSILIIRFYVDLSLGFMDKSIAFMVGGLLFIGLGFWIDRTRKSSKKGVKGNEA